MEVYGKYYKFLCLKNVWSYCARWRGQQYICFKNVGLIFSESSNGESDSRNKSHFTHSSKSKVGLPLPDRPFMADFLLTHSPLVSLVRPYISDLCLDSSDNFYVPAISIVLSFSILASVQYISATDAHIQLKFGIKIHHENIQVMFLSGFGWIIFNKVVPIGLKNFK